MLLLTTFSLLLSPYGLLLVLIGGISLQSELTSRKALISSWNKNDRNHLIDILELWLISEKELNLLEFWYYHNSLIQAQLQSRRSSNADSGYGGVEGLLSQIHSRRSSNADILGFGGMDSMFPSSRRTSNADMIGFGGGQEGMFPPYFNQQIRRTSNADERGGSTVNNFGTMEGVLLPSSQSRRASYADGLPAYDPLSSFGGLGQGVLAYEVNCQIGIVIRKNLELGLMEDCWRLAYLPDLLSFSSDYSNFDHFLAAFFPQLLPVIKLSSNDEEESSKKPPLILVKYFAHNIDIFEVVGPPALGKSHSYQTIGLVNESTENIFSRY
jgi:hypothetical protein